MKGIDSKAPGLHHAEPPEVRLKLLFVSNAEHFNSDWLLSLQQKVQKAYRTFTAFLLFLGDCILPEYFLVFCVIHTGLWFCLMLFGSWWDCHNRFEDFPDNQPGITLPFHPIAYIILLLWHLRYEHNRVYFWRGRIWLARINLDKLHLACTRSGEFSQL